MALQTSDDGPVKNPGQTNYENRFANLQKREETGDINTNNPRNSISGIKSYEESPKEVSGDYINKVTGTAQSTTSKISGNFKSLKRKGPLAAIIALILGGSVGISMLLSPGLLIIHLKETMAGKYNTQLASMDVRTTKILATKMGTTSGTCGSVITIACKYSTMSDKQISNFEKAGITVKSETTSITGRAKPTSFEFEGKAINAAEFSGELVANTKFRSAIKLAYNPKFAGFSDSIWKKVANFFYISKKPIDISSTDEEANLKTIQEDIKNGTKAKVGSVNVGDEDPATGKTLTQGDVDAIKAAEAAAETATEDGTVSAAKKVLNTASATAGGTINAIKITGIADTACTAYTTVQEIALAAKVVRATQLARYAMIFLSVADKIKAGDANPDEVSYLGKVLTTEAADDNGAMKSATDSFGYKYTAYGDTGSAASIPTSASRFMVGGGFTGKLSNTINVINENTGGNAKTTCKFLANPLVQVGSFMLGGIAWLGAETGVLGAFDIAKVVGIGIVQGAIYFLPAMLQDIVAGVVVDKTTVGGDAGEAITSGSSAIMGTTAKFGGNAPLTPDQAVAYNDLSNNIAAQYAEEDQIAYSPFDITNSNTFMGKIAMTLTPYVAKMSSLTGVLNSITSITTNSVATITSQKTMAASTDQYTMCQDIEYRSLNLATDPYCNVVYGIPTDALSDDPVAVADDLVNNNQINEETGAAVAGSDYSIFLTNCINRTAPLGDASSASTGSECLFSDINKNYYLYYIDQRVDKGMDD